MESEQLRKESHSSGPQDELEYWKRRAAQFSQIVTHLQGHEVSKPYLKASLFLILKTHF
jgi:dynein heavy chain